MAPDPYSALVVLFEPPADWAAGMQSLRPSPSESVVVANGEQAIERVGISLPGTILRLYPENRGIAGAYSAALHSISTEWLLFLDQDSTPDPEFIVEMFAALHSAAESESVAVITPRITDRSLGVSSDRREHPNSSNQIRRPPRFINSGSLFRVRALREIGGAWERLHVDLVDSELAIRLDQAGWAELHVPTATLHHSLGHLQAHRMLRRVVFATNHSAARREAIGKGLALVLRRHGLSSRGTRTVLRNAIGNIISMLLFEEDRLKKLIAFVRGMRSGWFDHVQ